MSASFYSTYIYTYAIGNHVVKVDDHDVNVDAVAGHQCYSNGIVQSILYGVVISLQDETTDSTAITARNT